MKDRLDAVTKAFAPRCDYFEVHVEETEESRVAFAGDVLADLGMKVDFGGNVRACWKGGWGFVSFNSLDKIEAFAEAAVEQAKHVGLRKTVLADVQPVRDDVPMSLETDPRSVPLADKVEILRAYNERVLASHESITSSSVRYFDRIRKFWYANGEGSLIHQERMDLGGAVRPIATKAGDAQSFSASFGGSRDFDVVHGLEDEIDRACEIAVGKLAAPKVKGGEYTVILDPRLAGVFVHEAFGHLSEGDNVYEDKNLQEIMQIGRTFGSPSLNVYDSGLDRGVRGYLVYDDEGVPTEKTYLLEGGVLSGRLHSRETAGKLGERPTGNARAIDYRYAPICRMRNTCIETGTNTFDEMLSDIDLGVYCIAAQGGQTNGEMFTFTAANAYMIRGGKIAEMVRDVTLTGNVFTTLKNIDMIGDDFSVHDGPGGCGKGGQFPLQTSHGSPHVRIRNVVIGGE